MPHTSVPHRRWLSGPALLALMVLLTLSVVGMLRALQQESNERANSQAVDGAQVIVDLVVRRNVQAADLQAGHDLSRAAALDMQGDVAVLQRNGRVAGLTVWRTDGTPLFAGTSRPPTAGALSAPELARARSGSVWIRKHPGHMADVDVFLAYRVATGSPAGVVQVVLPERQLAGQVRRGTTVLEVAMVALLVLAGGGLLLLRSRLRRREYRARHDPLTGLLNRAALLDDSQDLLQQAGHLRPTALLVIDLDGFRAVNDTLGHAAGDDLLVQVATALRASVRAEDIVARLGGDEFAVLIADVPSAAATAEQVLGRLRASTFEVHGVMLAVDASIGVALAPLHGTSVQRLLQLGDIAMYQAKRTRSGTALYDPATDDHDIGRLALLVELRRAIARHELVLHYQPQVALSDNSVVGVEALVRWQHPQRGLLAPDDFVPLAEPTGLMQPLTEWVLTAAVRQAAAWHRAGTPMRVAVNISPRSLLEGDLPELVLSALAAAALPVDLLELEVTETAVLTNLARAAAVLERLAALGIKVSIDDFGAGYTSLAHLRTLPVKALKLDRALVTTMLERPDNDAIAEAVIGLGHRLGLLVLAEGVETPDVCRRLRELSCDEVQGYWLTHPLPARELAAWLDDWRLRHPAADRPVGRSREVRTAPG